MPQYFYETTNLPDFNWKSEIVLQPFVSTRKRQGRFLREIESLGFLEVAIRKNE